MKQNKVIGLTGGIASGKSLVTSYLEEKGYPVIDSDKIVKELQESPLVLQGLDDLFPGAVTQGGLDRDYLGRLVFHDPEAREKLDAYMHPLVFRSIENELKNHQGIVFVDMPLLIETLDKQENLSYDEIWLIWIPKDLQVSRLMVRDGISRGYAQEKIDSQLSLEEKRPYAQVLIDNTKDPDNTKKLIDKELKRLCSNA